MRAASPKKDVIAVVLKGYPRLSETFIAQELLALQKQGFNLQFISLRHPTDKTTHPIHDEITAPVNYLPEYLHREPLRVLKAWFSLRRTDGYRHAKATWWRDLKRDRTPNRIRRFGQALVLATELPAETAHIYAHFLHTPASVARYASQMRDLPWSCSAHAKDIWTSPDWEISEKLEDLEWLVTCTSKNVDHLRALSKNGSKVELMYHGLDLARFAVNEDRRHIRDGSNALDPVRLVSVGRAVAKKGYDDLLASLGNLPEGLNWSFTHIGGGPLLPHLKSMAISLGIADRIDWRGAQSQQHVLEALRRSDIFVLASRITQDGDRDGLPNVLMEAQSQKVAVVATDISAIPELIRDGETGLLVPSQDPEKLAGAILALCKNPEQRTVFANKGDERLRDLFDAENWNARLAEKFRSIVDPASEKGIR
ncbi:MAG: colanic acid biosynthesis glycosyltransferase WcaL [Sneathiella sp.]|nr:MAG: colanic acid biosynthesis glycosyltransferase WcaL [Sneathiella sp.]